MNILSGLKLGLRKVYAASYHKMRMVPPLTHLRCNSGVILNYHYFTATNPSTYLEIRLSSLRAQLSTLLKYFEVVPLTEALCSANPKSIQRLKRPRTYISVDDADSSFLDALPIFESLGVPVTLFAPVGLCLGKTTVDGLRSWILRHWQDLKIRIAPFDIPAFEFFDHVSQMSKRELEQTLDILMRSDRSDEMIASRTLLSREELREVSHHQMVTLRAHAMSHARLATLPDNWLRWEIERSLALISEIGGLRDFFAYPYGALNSFSEKTNSCLAEHGVRHALTTLALPLPACGTPFLIGRTSAIESTWKPFIRGNSEGAFECWDRTRYGNRQLAGHDGGDGHQ